MKLQKLHLKNIGPFLDDEIEFATFENSEKQVTILTGENGTGKTVILDALRKLFLQSAPGNIRAIGRSQDFSVKLQLNFKGEDITLHAVRGDNAKTEIFNVSKDNHPFYEIYYPLIYNEKTKGNIWIMNYWTSQNDHSPFNISSLDFIKPEEYLLGSLNGIQKNSETTKIVTFFDYYKSSENPEEKKEGEFIFEQLKKIFKICLYNGEFVHVERTKLLPVIKQNDFEVTLEKLSSGNLYLAQRLISLLGQMYSVYKLNELKIEELCNTPGILMIDEAENHLHPKWQKTFLHSILGLFPNLQIIVATHSPFIVGSVKGARVYVCKPQQGYSIISEETNVYSNKPIDEILATEVFGQTSAFAYSKIDELLEQRIKAINDGNKEEEKRIETKLLAINPQYFSYLNIDDILNQLKNNK